MDLVSEVAHVLFKHNHELRTNTPVEVLAEHMVESLKQLEDTMLRRSEHPFYHPERRAG